MADNNLDFSSSQWNAHAAVKNVSYIIGQTTGPDPAYIPAPPPPTGPIDPATGQPMVVTQPYQTAPAPAPAPSITLYPLDRMDAAGSWHRLGTYSSLAAAQAAAQADANS